MDFHDRRVSFPAGTDPKLADVLRPHVGSGLEVSIHHAGSHGDATGGRTRGYLGADKTTGAVSWYDHPDHAREGRERAGTPMSPLPHASEIGLTSRSPGRPSITGSIYTRPGTHVAHRQIPRRWSEVSQNL